MELRHAVDFLAGVAGEDAHAELLVVVVGVDATHADKLIPADAQLLGIATHVLAEEVCLEVVVAGRHGSVDGIERRGAHQLHGLVEGEAVLDVVAQALEVAQGGVALVAVVDVLLDAEFLEHEGAADAEQDLLLQAVLVVAAVKVVGDGAVILGVHLVVRVQQVEFDASHVHVPDKGVDLVVLVGDIDHQLVAVGVELALDGQRVEILCVIFGYLLTVHRQRLREVAEAIEQADTTEIDVGVGSLLEVVAGQHAQAAAVDLQHLVEAKLHAEVGHGRARLVDFLVHVLAKLLIDVVDLAHQLLVLDDRFLAVVVEALQEQNGVVAHLLVEFLVEALEEVAGLIVPCPPKVVCQFVEAVQLLRQ